MSKLSACVLMVWNQFNSYKFVTDRCHVIIIESIKLSFIIIIINEIKLTMMIIIKSENGTMFGIEILRLAPSNRLTANFYSPIFIKPWDRASNSEQSFSNRWLELPLATCFSSWNNFLFHLMQKMDRRLSKMELLFKMAKRQL